MAVNSTTEPDYRLPCGRELEQVWERLDSGALDAHETRCPQCRAARDSLLALRDATRELIDEPEPTPPDLVGRIMSAVRAEVRRGRTLSLPTPLPGTVEVTEQAVAAVLRYAADTVPGVRARRCRVRGAGAGPDGARLVEVQLAVAIRFGDTSIGSVLPIVRERVAAALGGRIGLVMTRLDLEVSDIYRESDR